MIDFSKIYCKSHPFEVVTNFCNRENCMIGLCATCVCTHTQYHASQRTTPQYQNIRETFTQTLKKVRNTVSKLEDTKLRINSLNLSIQKQKHEIKTEIGDAKQSCIEIIREHFDTYGKEVQEMMINEREKNGYHNSFRMESLSSSLSKQIASLINISHDLNSMNFLECARKIKKQTLASCHQLNKQAALELQQNQEYQPSVRVNSQIINQLKLSLKKMMVLKFKYPGTKIQENKYSNLCELATQKSIEENCSNDYNRKFYHTKDSVVSNNYIMQNSHLLTFKHIPNIDSQKNQSKNYSQFNHSPALIATSKSGSNLHKSSSGMLQGLAPSKNPLLNSQSTVYHTYLSPDIYTGKSGVFQKVASGPYESRCSSLSKLNNSCVSNAAPKESRILGNLNASSSIKQQPVKKFDFTPQYIDLNSEPQTPVKKFKDSQVRGTSNYGSKVSSKKGIKLCTTSDILTEGSKQNSSLNSSFCNSVLKH